MGLTVICSHECGLQRLLSGWTNGYIINPDQASLVDAMKKISAHPQSALDKMSATSQLLASLWTTENGRNMSIKYMLPVK